MAGSLSQLFCEPETPRCGGSTPRPRYRDMKTDARAVAFFLKVHVARLGKITYDLRVM